METNIETIEISEKTSSGACGCGSGGCGCHSGGGDYLDFNPDQPARYQLIQEGDHIVEFGSGTGQEAVAMAAAVGVYGKVTGIDFSDKNIESASNLRESVGLTNLEFIRGDIRQAPVEDESADLIFATCVFNLQDDKQQVADEMYRIVKHNGYVCVSDFVILEDIPEGLRKEAASFAGCIEGAEKVDAFMNYFRKTGFTSGGIVEVKKVKLPDEMLEKHLTADQIERYNDINADEGIFSVVLVVEKPETCTAETCCHNPDKHKDH